MPMTVSEFGQLKKLLTLATSDNDHEALASWRKATALVARHGYTWEAVLNRVCTIVNEVEPMGDAPDEMEDLFDKALRGADGTFRDTLLSIKSKYDARGFLTPRQREVVENAAERTVDRHPGGRFR